MANSVIGVEQFDRVDENDVVIGITNKTEAHSLGYIHRVVAVYVFDAPGRLYVQHHVKAGLLDHSVGGHVMKGESYDAAAIREASEELGIIEPLEYIGAFYSDETYSGTNYRHIFRLYSCRVRENWVFQPNQEVRNITPMEIEALVKEMNACPERFTPGFINSMEYYLEHIHSPLRLNVADYKSRVSG